MITQQAESVRAHRERPIAEAAADRWQAMVRLKSPSHSQRARGLCTRVLHRIQRSFDASQVLETLEAATDGEVYLVGGTIRRGLLDGTGYGDLDFMVPNGDNRAFEALDALHVPFVLNRTLHRKYQWNGLRVELFQPSTFYRGFPDVTSAIHYFDLRVNALALHVGSRRIIDPFGIVSSPTRIADPGINWPRWADMPSLEVAVLAIRFMRIMYEHSELTISSADANRLRREVVPILNESEWGAVCDRFPRGKEAFIRALDALVIDRTRP